MIRLMEDVDKWIKTHDIELIEDCGQCGTNLADPVPFATTNFRGIKYKCKCGNTPFSVIAIADVYDLEELLHVDKL